MGEKIRGHIRSNVIGYVALFVALSGTAYAVDGPLGGQNQVGSEDIINSEVRTADLRDANVTRPDLGPDSVNSAKVVDDSLAGGDVLNNSLTGDDVDESALGTVPNADQLDNLDSSDIGLSFFTGRVSNLLATGTTGSAPSGLSGASSTSVVADQIATLSPSQGIVMRDLSVILTQPVGCGGLCGSTENVTVALEALSGTSVATSISCNVLTGGSSCTAAERSATVAASSPLRLTVSKSGDAQIAAGTDAMFSWRATAP